MTVVEKVQSNVKPNTVEFDEKHVYVHENIVEVPEEERTSEIEQLEDGQELAPLYQYKTTEYEKDEFLQMLSAGQITLSSDITDLQDMILELSGVVYA